MDKEASNRSYDHSYFIDQQRQSHKLIDHQLGFLITYRLYLRKILKYQNRGRFLDFGCGRGHFLKLAEKYFETYGIDISEFCIKETQINSPGTKTICGSWRDLDKFENGFFDVITAIDVLEHMKKHQQVLKLFHNKLAEKGILLINVPNTGSLGKKFKGEDWFAYRDKTHKQILSKNEWIMVIENVGFTKQELFYDGLWDTPYMKRIPISLQNISLKIPMLVLINLIRMPEKFGENLCIIAKKNDE